MSSQSGTRYGKARDLHHAKSIEPASPLADWIGRRETMAERITLAPALAAAAMLDDRSVTLAEGGSLPPLWHWFYFLPKAPQSRLARDGHPERGDFLPPIDLPRRMFAGARLRFLAPLIIGEIAERDGTIKSLVRKEGKSGPLVFLTVAYVIRQDGRVCVEEEQEIVFRGDASAMASPPVVDGLPPPPTVAWVETVIPDPVLLFRFSALTFNGHRIHYDRTYAMQVEGYPGLVVHGPLTALLLLQLVRRHTDRPIAGYRFRAKAPLFDLAPFRLTGVAAGGQVDLRAEGPDGQPAMTAVADLG